jgi:hypothetical protein
MSHFPLSASQTPAGLAAAADNLPETTEGKEDLFIPGYARTALDRLGIPFSGGSR